MTLPYKGDKGVKLVQKLKRTAKKFLPPNIKPVFAFKSKKLASHFKIKDNTNTKHKHDLVYKIQCPQEHCLHSYIGETARRLEERILERLFWLFFIETRLKPTQNNAVLGRVPGTFI